MKSLFHSQLAINGIPLNLALFFVVIVQARNDGSIGVICAQFDSADNEISAFSETHKENWLYE